MKKSLNLVMLLIFLMVGASKANAYTLDTPNMEGAVSKYRVVMQLHINTNTGNVSGWYYYKSKGSKNKIQLSGKIYGDPIDMPRMKLTEKVNGKVTGYFDGDFWVSAVGNMGYEGTWTSPTGKKLEFEIDYFK